MNATSKIPNHVAIIMDGNGRWALRNGFMRTNGHETGGNRIREIVEQCQEIGVSFLTLYAFSTENWSRPKDEVDFLMDLLIRFLDKELPDLKKNNVRLNTIGRTYELPEKAQDKLKWAINETKQNNGIVLTLALNYGSRIELTDAVNKILEKVKNGTQQTPITENDISQNLYDSSLPDPELLIRTAGEMRISNFLLWQISYSELVITDVFFPDFSREEFMKTITVYQSRKRRFGGLINQ
jgi:undecaprenyl diphosphate synthase